VWLTQSSVAILSTVLLIVIFSVLIAARFHLALQEFLELLHASHEHLHCFYRDWLLGIMVLTVGFIIIV